MLKIVSIALCLSLIGCISQRKMMDSWIGSTKQDLILKWGPPERTASDGGTGEILVYSSRFYNATLNMTTYQYRLMYADNDGKIYHWLLQSGTVPPQQMNMNVYFH
jgi:hypothetical protein